MTNISAGGAFRRRMRAVAGPHLVEAAVEDDYHHMEVTLEHDGRAVTAIRGLLHRAPWSTCPGATSRLVDLVGQPVSTRIWDLPPDLAVKLHCTHLLDAALLAIAQAARGGERRYEIRVPDRIDEATAPHVIRDGREVLRLNIMRDDIVAPSEFAGQNTRKLLPWAAAVLDDDTLEALSIMRRGLLVSRGRSRPENYQPVMSELRARMSGACFSFQPDVVSRAVRENNRRFLSDRPEDFLLPL
jgi:hypothetical protein